ncbi:probable G-protein coupled receptor 21 [Lytechinus pictus]|uniref:probable G-protein coupled receptor 21 n=1 Tax=Lytechinus pictus TaxID=7653 RepID=UPI0030B9EF8A
MTSTFRFCTMCGDDDDVGGIPTFGSKGETEDDPMNPLVVSIIEALFVLLIAVLAVFGNVMNIVVIGGSKSLKNCQGYFLLSLAIADLGMGIVATIGIAPATMHRWPYGDFMCQFSSYVTEVCTRVSLIMIIGLSIERYIAVIHPFQYNRIVTKNRVLFTIIITWLLCLAFFLVLFTEVGLGYEFDLDKLACSAAYEDTMEYYIAALAILLVPSFAVITFTSISVHVRVLQSSKRRQILFGRSTSASPGNGERFPMHFRRNMKAFKMLVIIAGVYYITWLPYTIIASLVLATVCHKTLPSLVEFLAFWLTVSNSGFNVFVYFAMNRKFRNKAKDIFQRLRATFLFCCCRHFYEVFEVIRRNREYPNSSFQGSVDRRFYLGIRNSKGEVVPTTLRIKSGSFSDATMNAIGVIPTDQHIFSLRSLKKMRSEPMRKKSVAMPTMSLKMEMRREGGQPKFFATEVEET